MRLEVLARADRDLEPIYEYGAQRFGFAAATGYSEKLSEVLSLLPEQPRMGRARPDLAPDMRIHTYRSHVIFYRLEANAVVIVRVLHGRQDWRRHLD